MDPVVKTVGAVSLVVGIFLGGTAWPAGDVLWEDQVDGGIDFGNAVVTDGMRAFAVGVSQDPSSGSNTSFVRSYDSRTGALSWEQRYAEPGNALTAAASADLVFTAGEQLPLLALDARTGAVRWEDDPGGNLHGIAAGDGLVVASGLRNVGPPPGSEEEDAEWTDLLVRGYDARSGRLLWEDVAGSGNGVFDAGYALTIHRGRVFVVGSASGFGEHSLIVRAYDARNGRLLWEDLSAKPATAWRVAAYGSRVFVAGQTDLPDGASAPFLRAYEARAGSLLWEHEAALDVPVVGAFLDVAATRGRVVVAGSDGKFLVQAHDSRTGARIWRRRSAVPGQAQALVASRGEVFASGRIFPGSGGSDWLTQAYDAGAGSLRWSDRIENAGGFDLLRENDEANGRLVVVGHVQTETRASDFRIRAYDAR